MHSQSLRFRSRSFSTLTKRDCCVVNRLLTMEDEKAHDTSHIETAQQADRKASQCQIEEVEASAPVKLTWKSWLVVFISCFAIMSQVFVVTAAGSVIAFIVRDMGSSSTSGWIIQGPLLMQSVLSPFVGRLSDVLDRKFLASVPPLIAFAGAVISARATSMSMLIGGGILIGVTLATISIVQAIPSEVLPLKYRALANGFAFLGGAVGVCVHLLRPVVEDHLTYDGCRASSAVLEQVP